MIHVDELPVDIEEMRDWANGYKAMEALSWEAMGKRMGIPAGTLQPFCKGTYGGRNDEVARKIFTFRQGEKARQGHLASIPVDPGYFETPTSLRIRELLALASSGEITAAGMGPGIGKTMTAVDFLGRVSPVYMITMDEVTKSAKSMIRVVDQAIGVLKCPNAWPSTISAAVIAFLRGRRATMIVDEANHLEYEALEQLRRWHDATGVGICLMGNEELIARIESGGQSDAYGRLNSRIIRRVTQRLPEEGDLIAFCDAWRLFDPGIRKALAEVALRPGSGALRECRQIIKLASMAASEDGGSLQLAHVKWAIDARAVKVGL